MEVHASTPAVAATTAVFFPQKGYYATRMSQPNTRVWLREVLQPLKPAFREVLVMALFVNILALAVPVFVLQVYDRVVFHAGLSTLQGLVIGMAAVLIFDYVLRQARARVMQTVALRIDIVVGRKLFDKLMSLPLQVLEGRPAAYWQALFRDVDVVRNTVSGASALLIADLPFAVLFLGLTLVIAAPIAWVLLVILPLFLFVAWRSGNTMTTANRAERESALARDGLIAEMIAGRTTIKALALDRAMRPYWEQRHAENIERAAIRGAKADGYANLGTTLTMLTTVALTTVGAIAIISQQLTIGALIATNMLSGRLLGPFNQLVGTWRTYAGFRQAIERLGQVFNTASERQTGEIDLQRPMGELTFEDVAFSYSQSAKPVVDTINVTFPVGGVHALIGRNGSGKSTLLKLAQGLYPPSKGRVLLDGADIAQFTRTELARWIGYVPQECVLFAGTLRDNVGHRKPEATDEEIIEAATAAGVHEFIVDLPDGYGSEIGEAGQRLSAGQRQRIAIARALVGDPPVLLLDEPSSSLDRQAEQELRNTLAKIGKDRTVVVVTHSPILLSVCKDLVALDRGRVALVGPAEEILPRLWGGTRVSPHDGQKADRPAIVKPSPQSEAALRREGVS
jgi:ATP-binding cassette, subfamily C, bacterial LapB